MAMWFSHLRYVEAAAARLDRPLDRLALCWGCVCCDVDKLAPVSREVSHYGREGLSFPAEEFLDRTGLAPDRARTHAAFLAGYLSHLAVDEAWYGHLERVKAGLELAWTYDTTRALNLALDRRSRAHWEPAGLDFDTATGEEVLPHLRGLPGQVMRLAAQAYVGWSGRVEEPPEDGLLAPIVARFQGLAVAEAGRVTAIQEVLCPETLDQEVIAFTIEVLGRFLSDLDRRGP